MLQGDRGHKWSYVRKAGERRWSHMLQGRRDRKW